MNEIERNKIIKKANKYRELPGAWLYDIPLDENGNMLPDDLSYANETVSRLTNILRSHGQVEVPRVIFATSGQLQATVSGGYREAVKEVAIFRDFLGQPAEVGILVDPIEIVKENIETAENHPYNDYIDRFNREDNAVQHKRGLIASSSLLVAARELQASTSCWEDETAAANDILHVINELS